MASKTDQMIDIKKIVCYTQRYQEKQGIPHHWGATQGSSRLVRRQREGETVGKSPYCGFYEKELVRQSKLA